VHGVLSGESTGKSISKRRLFMTDAIPKTMKAARTYGYGDVRIDEVDVPQLQAGEALVRVRACGICGTDAHILKGAFDGIWPPHFPFTQGHEVAGEVVAVAEGVDMVKPGDRIVADDHRPCLTCRMCRTGRYVLCETAGQLKPGGHRLTGHDTDGGFAEYLNYPQYVLHKIPDSISFDESVIINTATTALNAINRSRIMPGDTVLVVGPGLMGLCALQLALASGSPKVIVTGRGDRLKMAKELGAWETVDTTQEDTVGRIMELTDGRGADVVLECAGSNEAMKSAMASVRRGGRVSLTGVNGNQEVPFITDKIVLDEVDIYGVRSHPNTWEATIALVAAGKLDTSRLVTHRFPLEKFMEGLDIFVNRKEGCIRVVINP
jgi:L-iditol 2-dehydrogenase